MGVTLPWFMGTRPPSIFRERWEESHGDGGSQTEIRRSACRAINGRLAMKIAYLFNCKFELADLAEQSRDLDEQYYISLTACGTI